LLTIFGLSLFIGWTERESTRLHKDRLAQLNSKLYNQNISTHEIQAKFEKKGIYKGKCVLEGSIKNNGYRTISSIELSVDFFNNSGGVIHTEKIHPLKASIMPRKTTIAALSVFMSGKEVPITPGESLRFKHVLSEQKDKDIVSPIKNKKYATNPNEWSGKLKQRITRIKF
jgi:hypothetical protein